MSPISELYNSLLCLAEANNAFKDRSHIFAELTPLLTKYDLRYGVALVHTHCQLSDGEIMLDNGNNVTFPQLGRPDEVFPNRWLPTGIGYEFVREPIPSPPPELVKDFQTIIGDLPLGLYYSAMTVEEGIIAIETTEGNRNIVERYKSDDPSLQSKKLVETAWLPGSVTPVTMACTTQCVADDDYDKHSYHTHFVHDDSIGISCLSTS